MSCWVAREGYKNNLQQLLTSSDAQLTEIKMNLLQARNMAVQDSGFAYVEILEEKIAQLREAQERKFVFLMMHPIGYIGDATLLCTNC